MGVNAQATGYAQTGLHVELCLDLGETLIKDLRLSLATRTYQVSRSWTMYVPKSTYRLFILCIFPCQTFTLTYSLITALIDSPFMQNPACTNSTTLSTIQKGAVCSAGLVTVAVNLSGGSGNPDNCRNLCSCTQSTCPAVMVACTDATCQGISGGGSSLGKCAAGLGTDLGNCPCII